MLHRISSNWRNRSDTLANSGQLLAPAARAWLRVAINFAIEQVWILVTDNSSVKTTFWLLHRPSFGSLPWISSRKVSLAIMPLRLPPCNRSSCGPRCPRGARGLSGFPGGGTGTFRNWPGPTSADRRPGSEAPLKLEPLKAAGLWRVWIAMDKGPPNGVQYSILAVENCDEHILWKLLPNYLDPCRLGNWLLLCADHFNEHWSKCNNSMSLTCGHFGWGLNLIQINQVFSARDPQKLRAQTHLNQSTRYFSVQAVTPCAEW